jgi:hypothetical protein
MIGRAEFVVTQLFHTSFSTHVPVQLGTGGKTSRLGRFDADPSGDLGVTKR